LFFLTNFFSLLFLLFLFFLVKNLALDEPVDVYSIWLDHCERANVEGGAGIIAE
jgi:hypothetical protein